MNIARWWPHGVIHHCGTRHLQMCICSAKGVGGDKDKKKSQGVLCRKMKQGNKMEGNIREGGLERGVFEV